MKHWYLLFMLTLCFSFTAAAQADKKQDEQEQTSEKPKKKSWFQSMKKGSLEPREERVVGVSIFGSIKGYTFDYVSCVGDAATGKVTFTFTYTFEGLPQQTVSFPRGGTGTDRKGEKYSNLCEGPKKRVSNAGSTETVLFEMNHVPTETADFELISFTVTSTAGNTVLEFRDVKVDWGTEKE